MIILIPFQLLKLRKEIEKERTEENLKALILDIDIIELEHKKEMKKKQEEVDALKLLLQWKSPEEAAGSKYKGCLIFFDTKCSK